MMVFHIRTFFLLGTGLISHTILFFFLRTTKNITNIKLREEKYLQLKSGKQLKSSFTREEFFFQLKTDRYFLWIQFTFVKVVCYTHYNTCDSFIKIKTYTDEIIKILHLWHYTLISSGLGLPSPSSTSILNSASCVGTMLTIGLSIIPKVVTVSELIPSL